MFIKLLCINTTHFKESDNNQWTVNEGEVINVLVNEEGVRIEYKKDHYSLPFDFYDIEYNFISAFDEERYNDIYKRGYGCKLYLENGKSYELGDVVFKVGLR